MRLPLLTLNILISVLLLVLSEVVFASAKPIKISEQNSVEIITALEKSKKTPRQRNRSTHAGDVWERIRSGMQIYRLSPTPRLSNRTNDLKNRNTENPSSPSVQRYLYKRMGFKGLLQKSGSQVVKKSISDSLSSLKAKQQTELSTEFKKNKGSIKAQVVESRFRTLINVHPESHQIDSKITKEGTGNKPSSLTDSYIATSEIFGTPQSVLLETRQQVAKQTLNYERVNKHIVWYSEHRGYLRQVAERSSPYLYHIVETLSKNKLPLELALLPIVESAYQPTAQSPKNAAGLWQFIPGTGFDFDLRQSADYDERLDITASTKAAIRYLSFLKQHYKGDWLLALAAYNCGPGTVDEAINRNLAAGIDTDFWSLRLPEETQQYVPRFLALSSIFANPANHGLKLTPVRNEPYFVNVTIDRKSDMDYLAKKDLAEIAKLAGLDYQQFTRLNPGYLQPQLATEGPFTFIMPTNNANQLYKGLARIEQFLAEPSTVTPDKPPFAEKWVSVFAVSNKAPTLVEKMFMASETGFSVISDPFLSFDVN